VKGKKLLTEGNWLFYYIVLFYLSPSSCPLNWSWCAESLLLEHRSPLPQWVIPASSGGTLDPQASPPSHLLSPCRHHGTRLGKSWSLPAARTLPPLCMLRVNVLLVRAPRRSGAYGGVAACGVTMARRATSLRRSLADGRTQGGGPRLDGGGAATSRGWPSLSASLVVEAMAALGFVGRLSRTKYSL
jgi:hypothetical protein